MLKNMAVHELALLVSFYGVSVETIKSVKADKAFSKCETRGTYSAVGASLRIIRRRKFGGSMLGSQIG